MLAQIPTQTPNGARCQPDAAIGLKSSRDNHANGETVSTVTPAVGGVTPPTQQDLLLMGLAAFRDVVDQHDDLPPRKRAEVVKAVAGFLADLRQIGALR